MDSPPATPVEPPQQCDDSVQPPNPPEEHLQTVGFCAPCEPVEHAAPVNRLVLPSDVAEFTEEDESIYIIGTREGKVTKIAGLEDMKNLKTLVLRSCLVSHMEGLETCQGLEKLELYDNHIEYITGIQTLHSLRILDLSFNSIRQLVDLGRSVPRLQELYVAQNKLRKIEGLQGLPHLRLLDLGANRIRAIEGLENCTQLRSLWLGKNKIEQIEGLETLSELEQLDIQNNRLTDLGQGLVHLSKLRELYLACNKIPSVVGLPVPGVLSTVDLSTNNVQSVQGIEQLPSLQEVWMSSSALSSFDALTPFTKLPRLTCLYLEHSPIAKDFEYRMQLAKMIPSLEQLDATNVHRPST